MTKTKWELWFPTGIAHRLVGSLVIVNDIINISINNLSDSQLSHIRIPGRQSIHIFVHKIC